MNIKNKRCTVLGTLTLLLALVATACAPAAVPTPTPPQGAGGRAAGPFHVGCAQTLAGRPGHTGGTAHGGAQTGECSLRLARRSFRRGRLHRHRERLLQTAGSGRDRDA